MITNSRHPSDWRAYQKKLQGSSRRKSILRKLPIYALYSAGSFFVLFLIVYGGSSVFNYLTYNGHEVRHRESLPNAPLETPIRKKLSTLPKHLDLSSAALADHFVLESSGTRFIVESSLDQRLQDYILGLLARSKTLRAAVVVLNPADGRILAMVGHDKEGKGDNLCTKAVFPAASLFKIVSAAAALEAAGFTPARTVFFDGRKHTLYKKQLRRKVGKYSTKISFKRAFSSSINPVFGKLGIYELGQEVISRYAERFLFNQPIPFDLPVEMSTIRVPDGDFGLAEIASGFNRETLISPLHAAMLASAAANNGIMMVPSLVDRVLGESGELLYQSRPAMLTSPISRGTAKDLKELMGDTVVNGTCRKAFRVLRRKTAFRDVELGAKTGTINDRLDRYKYDWLTAYALPRNGARGICIAVLGVHGEFLGIRANELGRYIINYYITS